MTLPLPPSQARPSVRFLWSHPAHLIALGFGSGLARFAPGTVGTLWAWLTFALLAPLLSDTQWAVGLLLGLGVGWWACTVTARHLQIKDPSAIVWDEIIAFWLVLWMISPAGWMEQAAAFGLFRLFDSLKPGPIGWADRCFKLPAGQAPGPAQGWGIIWDDLVAAACTLFTFALWRTLTA